MTKKFLKFIEKSPYKDRFLDIIEDIYRDRLDQYDIKPLVGRQNQYRLRVGSVRFIFEKTHQGNMIIDVNNRGDIY
jgi:mRNA-degrading endonuclease RelE of RelBE toxin-antitoxin system